MNRVFADGCRRIALRRQDAHEWVRASAFLLERESTGGDLGKCDRRRPGCVIGRLLETSDPNTRRSVAFLESLGNIRSERIDNTGLRRRREGLCGNDSFGRRDRSCAPYGRREPDRGAGGRAGFSIGLVDWRLRKGRLVCQSYRSQPRIRFKHE